jgi:pimeloyl-ACP methyl ester carboxylesterase
MLRPLRFGSLGVAALVAARAGAALDESPCRLETGSLPAVFAQCASVAVPLDFTDPSGPTLSLAVARIPAQTGTPAPDPLVLINGGPGGSGIDLYLQARAAFEPVRRDRDILLVDQRGTGRSDAGLTCDIPDELAFETATAELLRATVAACLAEIEVDSRLFTTSAAVRDLELVRAALGVEQWNLYGISYGTRVAQHYLRRYPERVRALVLDGVVPAELVLGPDTAGNAQRALDEVFARCARDAACASRYGALDAKFAELEGRFAAGLQTVELADPLTGEAESLELAAEHFQAVVRLMSYTAPMIALLPLVIDEAQGGNYGPLAAHADILIATIADSLSFPMHNAVVCAEDAPYFASGRIETEPKTYLGESVLTGLAAICSVWPAGVRDEDFKTAIVSDRPVLLLSGELDPVTPPAYAARVMAGGLANARHLVAPGQGHGIAAVGCVPRLIREFLAAPVPAELAADCLEAEQPTPFFLGLHGPGP